MVLDIEKLFRMPRCTLPCPERKVHTPIGQDAHYLAQRFTHPLGKMRTTLHRERGSHTHWARCTLPCTEVHTPIGRDAHYLVKRLTHPLGPTRPYLRPAVMERVALTNRSLPRAERENFSILMSEVFSNKTSLTFVSRWEKVKLDSCSSISKRR